MGGIDWTNIPLEAFEAFFWVDEEREDGKGLRTIMHPQGEGVAQRIMMGIYHDVLDAYEEGLLPAEDPYEDPPLQVDEDARRFEAAREVPVIRDGRKRHEPLDSLTLADLPAILDALAAMEEEAARLDAERKRRRRNALAREKYKLKKLDLGEW